MSSLGPRNDQRSGCAAVDPPDQVRSTSSDRGMLVYRVTTVGRLRGQRT
jgi:hypothetical protein